MNVLIIGSGGREHAIAWKLSQSIKVDKLFICPGNAGTAEVGINIAVDVNDFEGIKGVVVDKSIEMVIVGPEVPLVKGIADFFKSDSQLKDIPIIGPSKAGARLEGSKDFAKGFMLRNNIPTAAYKSFDSTQEKEAFEFLQSLKAPYVIKADGLAAGKGVLIINDIEEAEQEIDSIFKGKFGKAGDRIVIEEFLSGIELSVFVLTDGESFVLLPEAKDYKRIGVGDTGLNTGGMGAVSPVMFADEVFMKKVVKRIIEPTINGLAKEEIPYQGFIFFGLINVKGEPFVIEYNVRMGDPETEAIMPRIKSDLFDLFDGVAAKTLKNKSLITDEKFVTTVMMVSGGYPEAYEKGKEIHGLSNIDKDKCVVFHAGTIIQNDKVVSAGGRVLSVSAWGNNLDEALNNSFSNVEKINFEKSYYRNDIGSDFK